MLTEEMWGMIPASSPSVQRPKLSPMSTLTSRASSGAGAPSAIHQRPLAALRRVQGRLLRLAPGGAVEPSARGAGGTDRLMPGRGVAVHLPGEVALVAVMAA